MRLPRSPTMCVKTLLSAATSFSPKGDYKQVEMVLVDHWSGATQTVREPWRGVGSHCASLEAAVSKHIAAGLLPLEQLARKTEPRRALPETERS